MLLVGLYVVVNLVLAVGFVKLLRRDAVTRATYLLAAAVAMNVLAALLIGHVPWYASVAPMCLSPLVAFVSFSILAVKRPGSYQAFHAGRKSSPPYVFGGLLLVLSQLSPPVGVFAVDRACDALARSRGERIRSGLEAYLQEYGEYPVEVGVLSPAYLPRMPGACGNTFRLLQCPGGDTLLIVDTPNRLGTNRCHLQTGNWSTIDTMDFDLCAGLE